MSLQTVVLLTAFPGALWAGRTQVPLPILAHFLFSREPLCTHPWNGDTKFLPPPISLVSCEGQERPWDAKML